MGALPTDAHSAWSLLLRCTPPGAVIWRVLKASPHNYTRGNLKCDSYDTGVLLAKLRLLDERLPQVNGVFFGHSKLPAGVCLPGGMPMLLASGQTNWMFAILVVIGT